MPETIDTTISTTPAAAATTTPAAAGPSADDLAAIRADLDAVKRENDDLRRSNEFWADRARSAVVVPPAPAVRAEPEPEDDTDLLDLITTGGPKAFDQFMRKKGYVTRTEAEEMASAIANTKANQLTTEAELLRSYPDLGNKDSDFFKQTARYYGDLVKQGVPEQLAMKIGAERAELEGMKTGKVKTPRERTQEAETQRQQRIKAQTGDHSTRPAIETGPDDNDDTLTDAQKAICRGMGISEEAYVKRLKSGTALGGLPRAR